MWRIGSAANCSESAEPSEEVASNPRDFFIQYTFHDVYYVNSQTNVRLAEIKSAETAADEVGMRTPRHLPTLPVILDNLGNPPLDDVAKELGVSVATIKRYLKHGAPRPVLLSLWWFTSWGLFDLDNEQQYKLHMSESLLRATKKECQAAKDQAARLARIGNFGTANEPMFGLDGANTLPVLPPNELAAYDLDTRPPLVFLVKR
ncbi:MAG: hypothetical protein ACOYNB_08660 [Aquabacterium sp.]|uniref:hypothetical protein n=1 Tax=Aquabacterium sp. TaxID=1872578 RepID=UPI003BBD4566